MAKSWKSFVKKDDDLSQDPESSQELSGIEKVLNLSLDELAKSNEQLKAILDEREALEEKMRQLANPSASQNQPGSRFESAVESINRKRREDQERFETKRKLEEKLKLKKNEFNAWAKKIKRIRDKVTRTKDEFDRKKDELNRVKKKVDDFVKKVKLGPSDDFDYEKLSGPLKKAVGDFPFTDKMGDRTDEIFNRPMAQITEKITEREPVKKIVEAWEEIKDKKNEAAKIKAKFEAAMKKKEELFEFDFDDFGSDFIDDFGNEDPEKVFKERDKRTPEKKAKEKKKKQSIFEKLKQLRKVKDEVKKAKKMIDDLPGDSGLPGERNREEDESSSDKKKKEEDSLSRREKRRNERKEMSRAERKAARKQDRMDRKFSKLDSETGDSTGSDSEDADDEKKKETDELEKKESKREEKLKDRMAQRREERRQERRKVKDKFD